MSLFDTQKFSELLTRIDNLQPDAQRQWGKMDAAQMLAHCNATLAIPAGEATGKQMFMGKVLGPFFKKVMIGGKPLKPNSPTAPNYIMTGEKDFAQEKERLVALLKTVVARKDKLNGSVHLFLGKLTTEEWDGAIYTHTNHHLRQFGV
jgi:hypothetical protein